MLMTRVLIMAGGRGLRLHPLTETRPKQMLRVGSKPILRSIVDGFVEQGFPEIWLALRYKAEMIQSYFGDGAAIGARIQYLIEDEPLGTAGALNLLPPGGRTIVSNADVMTRVDYRDLVCRHRESGCFATICTALHQQQIHFGVVETSKEGLLTGIREKPIESFQVNAGIYVIDAAAIRYAPQYGPFMMTDLLCALPSGSVNVYPIESFWLDIGRFEDLGRAMAYAAE